MATICLRFFVREGDRHAGQLTRDWLFEEARRLGVPGGTAFRAAAGFGRHGMSEDSFFELAGTLPESVEFALDEALARQLIARVGAAGLALVYVTHVVDVGITGS